MRECRATLSGPNGGMCGLRADAEHAIDPHHYMFHCCDRDRHVGHRVITKVIRAMYTQLGVTTKEEPMGLMEGQERPADILVLPPEVCRGAALPVALDVGVTEPGKDGAMHRGSWEVPGGALKAAAVYTKEKRDRFLFSCGKR